MGYGDESAQIPALMDQIRNIVPEAKFKLGTSNNKVDRIYMERTPSYEDIPSYADFGATPRQNGLLDVLDERLRRNGNK